METKTEESSELITAERRDDSAHSSEPPEKLGKGQWINSLVQKLVSLVESHWPQFQNSTRKKKFIWRDIASSLSNDDFIVTGQECDRKWRNLKIRYLAMREKNLKGDRGGYRLEYYRDMHNFLKDDPATINYLEQRVSGISKVKPSKDIVKDAFKEATESLMEWTDKSIDLLLKLLLEFKDWFSDKDSERDDSTLWEAISEQMKMEGHNPEPDDCHQQWQSLASLYEYHKSESEATGTLPLWPYYTRVRHIINSINIPTIGPSCETPAKRKAKGPRYREKKKTAMHIKVEPNYLEEDEVLDRSFDAGEGEDYGNTPKKKKTSISSNTGDSKSSSGEMQDLCTRLDRLEKNIAVCQRLDRLEGKLYYMNQHLETQHNTNKLLSQVLSELSRLNKNLVTRYQQGPSQDNLGSGITIVVPESNI